MIHHVIAIPTYKRPEAIARALDAVIPQLTDLPEGETASLFVVDNDPAGSGRAAVEQRGVRYALEPHPGIAAVRNRAIDDSPDATTVIFLDDDEAAEPGWLAALTRVYRDTRPTAVAGKVLTVFPDEAEEWVKASGAFIRPVRSHLQTMNEAASNNLLLEMAGIRDLGLRFDERFGLTGGSDSMFTRRLTQLGGTIRWAEDAIVIEQEDAARFTRRWVLMRTFRSGNTHSRVSIALAGPGFSRLGARVGCVIRGLPRIIGGIARMIVGTFTGSLPHRARGLRTAYRGAGMLAAAFGYAHNEYGRRRLRRGAAR